MQNSVSFRIYKSTERNPIFVEHCTYTGKIVINVPVGSKVSIIELRMNFSSTEFKVNATELNTMKTVAVNFDFDF